MKKYAVELSTYDEHSHYQAFSGVVEANSAAEAKRMLEEAAIEDGKLITIRRIEALKLCDTEETNKCSG
jgi:hypothetical protein